MLQFKQSSRPFSERRTPAWVANRLHIDLPLLAALILLGALGLVVIYSAGGQDSDLAWRHGIRMAIAFGIMFLIAQIHSSTMRRWAPIIYAIGIISLLAVLYLGATGKGAQRWLDIGIIRFQPSELLKLAVPIMAAWFFADKRLPPTARHLFIALILIALPTLLIAKQPDLGTALLISSSGLFVILLSGVRWKYIFTASLLALAAMPLLWWNMHDYQKARVLTFLNPQNDPLGTGYHIIQSMIAIGSGGIYGKGWTNGSQSNLEFLPERTTDFVFSVFSEEFGFLGILVMLALYLFIIIRGLYIATQAQDTFSRLLAGSLTLTFFVYTFINIGMVSGLMPVVGLPLPLISYGGSAMVTQLAAFGILMSIHTHRKLLST